MRPSLQLREPDGGRSGGQTSSRKDHPNSAAKKQFALMQVKSTRVGVRRCQGEEGSNALCLGPAACMRSPERGASLLPAFLPPTRFSPLRLELRWPRECHHRILTQVGCPLCPLTLLANVSFQTRCTLMSPLFYAAQSVSSSRSRLEGEEESAYCVWIRVAPDGFEGGPPPSPLRHRHSFQAFPAARDPFADPALLRAPAPVEDAVKLEIDHSFGQGAAVEQVRLGHGRAHGRWRS